MTVATCALLLAACGDVAPDHFTLDGVRYQLPGERNAPPKTAVRPGVEVIVYNSTLAELDALNCGPGHVGGCTMLLDSLCMVWLLDPGLIPAKVYAHLDRHERLGHCNGWTHTLGRSATGALVIDWQPAPRDQAAALPGLP